MRQLRADGRERGWGLERVARGWRWGKQEVGEAGGNADSVGLSTVWIAAWLLGRGLGKQRFGFC